MSPPAFEQVVANHKGDVLRVCLSILRDPDLGADATQETFLRLWRDLDRARPPAQVGAWLRKVAVTTSIDLLRNRRARAAALPAAAPGAEPAARLTPIQLAADAELRTSYEHALGELSERQRVVFLLRHEGGMRLREVAEALAIALPTVKTQFARACLKLQTRLSAFRPRP